MNIHNSCQHQELKHIPHSTPYCIDRRKGTVAGFIWIKSPCLPTPIVVGGVYLHASCQESDIKALAQATATAAEGPRVSASSPPLSSPCPVFLVGDFNARHMSWDQRLTGVDAVGNYIQERFISHIAQTHTSTLPRMTLLNTHFDNTRFAPTHMNADVDTVIDLALTSHPHMVKSLSVMSDEIISSDHYPLMLTFHISQEQVTAQRIAQALTREQARERLFGSGSVPVVPVPVASVPVPPVPSVPSVPVPSVPYIVRASPGRGRGLFCTTPLKKNLFVVQYTGEIIDEKEMKRRYPDKSTRCLCHIL